MNTIVKKGFTMIELIVVIAIISLISSVVISFIGDANTKASNTGNIRALQEVRTALNVYFNDSSGGNGSYPDNIELIDKRYISSINSNVRYKGLNCMGKECKGYQLAVPLIENDKKIKYGKKDDCIPIGIATGICYFVSSGNIK